MVYLCVRCGEGLGFGLALVFNGIRTLILALFGN